MVNGGSTTTGQRHIRRKSQYWGILSVIENRAAAEGSGKYFTRSLPRKTKSLVPSARVARQSQAGIAEYAGRQVAIAVAGPGAVHGVLGGGRDVLRRLHFPRVGYWTGHSTRIGGRRRRGLRHRLGFRRQQGLRRQQQQQHGPAATAALREVGTGKVSHGQGLQQSWGGCRQARQRADFLPCRPRWTPRPALPDCCRQSRPGRRACRSFNVPGRQVLRPRRRPGKHHYFFSTVPDTLPSVPLPARRLFSKE
jgi:hypothetical protein